MYKTYRLLTLKTLFVSGVLALSPQPKSGFQGNLALSGARRAVGFGERAAGSKANVALREWIGGELKAAGAQVIVDSFSGQTPDGPVAMANVIGKFPGTSGRAVAVSGHFDTKKIAGVRFLGANDAGSSTGFLLAFARAVSKIKHQDDIFVVFFDGEEAVGEWTDTDSRYGSRHLAAKWLADGTLSRLKALINVDMIGDKDLDVLNDSNSSAGLRDLTWEVAAKMGYAKYFRKDAGSIDDDHRPFAEVGVNVLDLIDFDYGPRQAYWHTSQDTVDKLSAASLQVVGDVVMGVVSELESRK